MAIATLILRGEIETPDYACIADTGREKSSTWDYLKNHVQPAIGFQIHVVPKSEFATVDLWRNDDLLIPAYTNITGQISKLPTFCSNEWKTRPCERWLRKQGVKKFEKWIGFSVDEPRRYLPMMKSQPTVVFPLVRKFYGKDDCYRVVREMGWPSASGSHCWMCPHMNDEEWQQITPEELGMAVKLDAEIRERDPNLFLHKSCKPLSEVVFGKDSRQRACDSGVCFV